LYGRTLDAQATESATYEFGVDVALASHRGTAEVRGHTVPLSIRMGGSRPRYRVGVDVRLSMQDERVRDGRTYIATDAQLSYRLSGHERRSRTLAGPYVLLDAGVVTASQVGAPGREYGNRWLVGVRAGFGVRYAIGSGYLRSEAMAGVEQGARVSGGSFGVPGRSSSVVRVGYSWVRQQR
jgi:hypothetical protein